MKKVEKVTKKSKGSSDNNSLKNDQMFGISFFGRDMTRLLRELDKRQSRKQRKCWVITVNPEFVMAGRRDKEFMDIINKSDIRVMDGIGLLWAREVLKMPRGIKRWLRAWEVGRKILDGKKPGGLISGADLMDEMVKKAVAKKEKVFFLGGWEERAAETGKFFEKKYPGLKYESCPGEPKMEAGEVIKKINNFGADYLLVAYGMKRQEEWINKNLSQLKVGVVMGVGRSFDYYSGKLKRAPEGWRKMGLEWLYSLIKEPKRWRRQLVLPQFILMVMGEN